MTSEPPFRLTPPQMKVLHLLHEGWACQTCGAQIPVWRKLSWYGFVLGNKTCSIPGSTLMSLHRRTLIAWEPCQVTLLYNGHQVPGFHLVLTPEGLTQVAARVATTPSTLGGVYP